VGIFVVYHFHDKVSIGTGIVYTPKGWWVFEKDAVRDYGRKEFNTVDYFEFPLFLQVYPHRLVWFRAGPVFSLAGVTKTRIVTTTGSTRVKEQYRFDENGSNIASTFVPGLEADLSIGNPAGFHGTIGIQYSGSFYENIDIKPVVLRLGFAYTLVK
jgi:hypothetical protein